jgi:WD repeat-containing protein 61
MANLVKPGNKVEQAHTDSVWTVSWAEGNVLTGSLDGTVKVWNKQPTLQATSQPQKVGVNSVVALKDGSQAVASYQDGMIRFFSLPDMTEVDSIDAGMLEAWTVCLSPNDDVLVSGTQKGSVNIWSMQEGHEKVATLETHNKFILSSAFSADVKLATAGSDGFVNVFDLETSQVVHKLEAHALPVRSIVFSPDGSLIYTASDDRHVSVQDTKSGTVVNSFSMSGMAFAVDASPDQRHFAVGCADHSVSVWDLGMQRKVHGFEPHNDQVWGVSFDRSDGTGKRFASVGDDAVLQLYG